MEEEYAMIGACAGRPAKRSRVVARRLDMDNAGTSNFASPPRSPGGQRQVFAPKQPVRERATPPRALPSSSSSQRTVQSPPAPASPLDSSLGSSLGSPPSTPSPTPRTPEARSTPQSPPKFRYKLPREE